MGLLWYLGEVVRVAVRESGAVVGMHGMCVQVAGIEGALMCLVLSLAGPLTEPNQCLYQVAREPILIAMWKLLEVVACVVNNDIHAAAVKPLILFAQADDVLQACAPQELGSA